MGDVVSFDGFDGERWDDTECETAHEGYRPDCRGWLCAMHRDTQREAIKLADEAARARGTVRTDSDAFALAIERALVSLTERCAPHHPKLRTAITHATRAWRTNDPTSFRRSYDLAFKAAHIAHAAGCIPQANAVCFAADAIALRRVAGLAEREVCGVDPLTAGWWKLSHFGDDIAAVRPPPKPPARPRPKLTLIRGGLS